MILLIIILGLLVIVAIVRGTMRFHGSTKYYPGKEIEFMVAIICCFLTIVLVVAAVQGERLRQQKNVLCPEYELIQGPIYKPKN